MDRVDGGTSSREPSRHHSQRYWQGYVQTQAHDKAQDVYQLCYAMQKTADEQAPVPIAGPLSDLLMQTDQLDAAIPFMKEAIEWSDMVLGHSRADHSARSRYCVGSGRLRRIGEAVYYLDRRV